MAALNVKIYSLKGSLFEASADVVVVPGLNGDIGIVQGDRILTYLLKEGTIYIIEKDKVINKLFVLGGRFFAQNDEVIITTEFDLLDLNKISEEEIRSRIKKIEDKLNSASDEIVKSFYNDLLEREKFLLSSYKESYY